MKLAAPLKSNSGEYVASEPVIVTCVSPTEYEYEVGSPSTSLTKVAKSSEPSVSSSVSMVPSKATIGSSTELTVIAIDATFESSEPSFAVNVITSLPW